jgi:hypothetical protein
MSSPSIEQLQELPLPAAISYSPQTWGWWVLLVIGILLVSAVSLLKFRRWRRDRYRREALARLDQIEHSSDDSALREVPELLKRVALSMPQRPDVGSLSGQAWQDFLQRNTAIALPEDFATRLAILAYAPDAVLTSLDAQKRKELLSLTRQWVESHHVAA